VAGLGRKSINTERLTHTYSDERVFIWKRQLSNIFMGKDRFSTQACSNSPLTSKLLLSMSKSLYRRMTCGKKKEN